MREKLDRRRRAGEVIAQGGAVDVQLQDLEDAAATGRAAGQLIAAGVPAR